MANRVTQVGLEVIASGTPNARVTQVVEAVIASGPAVTRLTQVCLCVIADVVPVPVKLPQIWVATT